MVRFFLVSYLDALLHLGQSEQNDVQKHEG
jgi:hypothetical protein